MLTLRILATWTALSVLLVSPLLIRGLRKGEEHDEAEWDFSVVDVETASRIFHDSNLTHEGH